MESSTGIFYWWSDLAELQALRKVRKLGPIAVTVGNFDGVHLGHRELLNSAVSFARAHNGISMVFTFNPHPNQVLNPQTLHQRLFDYEDQRERFREIGIQAVLLQPFSREFSETPPEIFFQEYIFSQVQPKKIVVGHDFGFGKGRSGGLELLKEMCQRYQVELQVVPAFALDGEIVSTSIIRKHLQEGRPEKAEKMLGRPYYLKGLVVRGDQRGRLLGFPTANLSCNIDFYPRFGVYATRCWLNGNAIKSVANLGVNKTFFEGDHNPVKIEVHLLESGQDLYGKELRVELLSFLRDEKKFASIEELKAQISRDCAEARRILL